MYNIHTKCFGCCAYVFLKKTDWKLSGEDRKKTKFMATHRARTRVIIISDRYYNIYIYFFLFLPISGLCRVHGENGFQNLCPAHIYTRARGNQFYFTVSLSFPLPPIIRRPSLFFDVHIHVHTPHHS